MNQSRSTASGASRGSGSGTTTRARTAGPATGKVSGATARSDGPAAGKRGTDLTGASVGDLMGEVAADLSTLIRKEVELAKAEVKQELAKAGKGAGMLGGAGYAVHLLLLFGSLALVFGIGRATGLGWASLVVAAIWAAVAVVLALSGRSTLRGVHPTPERTIESVEEGLRWARHPRS